MSAPHKSPVIVTVYDRYGDDFEWRGTYYSDGLITAKNPEDGKTYCTGPGLYYAEDTMRLWADPGKVLSDYRIKSVVVDGKLIRRNHEQQRRAKS